MANRNDGKSPSHDNKAQITRPIPPIGKEKSNAELDKDTQIYAAEAQMYIAELNNRTQTSVANKNNNAQENITQMNGWIQDNVANKNKEAQVYTANKQVEIAKINNDPLTLDANEATAYELIKKTGILKDLGAFEAKLASGDKEAFADALKLEKALKKDGKELTVDGKITEKTIAAARGLIGENLDAITKYEEVMKAMEAKAPSSVGAKVQTGEIKKDF